MLNKKDIVYKKKNSFLNISVSKDIDYKKLLNEISNLDINLDHKYTKEQKNLFLKIKKNLLNKNEKNEEPEFKLTKNIVDELEITVKKDWPKYLLHRYRYEIYPDKKIIDDYPPYLQIEPSSICNYRCVFCFETDKSFTNLKNGFMGTMKVELFKDIIDQAEGNIEFISLASRGEPLVAKDFDKMIEYTNGKFLNLKINTNASLLTEKKCHSILSSGVKTLVFSADAADEKLYSKLRVNGNLKKGYTSIKVFEAGNVFKKEKSGFTQLLNLSGIIYQHEPQQTWSQKKFVYDFFSLKAEISKLLKTLGMQNIEFQKASSLMPFNENALDIFFGKQKIAVIGEIELSVSEKLIKKPAFGFEIYPEKISLLTKNPKIKKTSKFPLSTRDINIVIDKSIAYQKIESLIAKGKIKHLTSFSLINTFEGKDIPKGSISMTFRFIFQSNSMSLTESDISLSMKKITAILIKSFQVSLRS